MKLTKEQLRRIIKEEIDWSKRKSMEKDPEANALRTAIQNLMKAHPNLSKTSVIAIVNEELPE